MHTNGKLCRKTLCGGIRKQKNKLGKSIEQLKKKKSEIISPFAVATKKKQVRSGKCGIVGNFVCALRFIK